MLRVCFYSVWQRNLMFFCHLIREILVIYVYKIYLYNNICKSKAFSKPKIISGI